MPWSASVSVHGSMPGSVLENILGVLGSLLLSWERIVK